MKKSIGSVLLIMRKKDSVYKRYAFTRGRTQMSECTRVVVVMREVGKLSSQKTSRVGRIISKIVISYIYYLPYLVNHSKIK